MQPVHARYPYFQAAREAVATADISLPTLVTADAPAVERGRERVERALLEGTVASEREGDRTVQAELLSYPIARILVSLLNSSAAVEKYATAEAATAIERLREDVETETGLQSVDRERVTLEEALREFDLENAVRERSDSPRTPPTDDGTAGLDTDSDIGSRAGSGGTPRVAAGPAGGVESSRSSTAPRYRVTVDAYLTLSSADWGPEWRLVSRELTDGEVPVSREELFDLLEAAIHERIHEGLPFDLPADEGIAAKLETQIEGVRRLLSERPVIGKIDRVVPELFPPCMENLVEKAERGAKLDPPEGFALVAFLTGIGMDADEIIGFCAETSLNADGIRYQTEYLRAKTGTQYPPPTGETLSAYGICHNERDHWKEAGDPLAYYEQQLEQADGEFTDWRERT